MLSHLLLQPVGWQSAWHFSETSKSLWAYKHMQRPDYFIPKLFLKKHLGQLAFVAFVCN